MSNFRIKAGVNVYPDLFVPYQPQTHGLQYTRRTPTGAVFVEEAPFIRFTFKLLDEAQFQAVMAQAGLTLLDLAPVTIYAQDENFNWMYFNGHAVRPALDGLRRGYFLYNVPLLVRDLFAAAVTEPEPEPEP